MGGEDVLLSIVVLDVKNHYLIPITLESILCQTDKRFEVLILTQKILPRELSQLHRNYSNLSIVEVQSDEHLPKIKNIALKHVKGKYIHFLYPGEYYLSKFSLNFVFDKIGKEKDPDIICFSGLLRDNIFPPKTFYPSFSKALPGEKYYPILVRDVIFLRETVETEGGFDSHYSPLQAFALVTKISLKEKYKILSLKRVIVDYELQKDDPEKYVRYISDLIKIIYRYYGFHALFRASVLKELMDFSKKRIRGIKRFFVWSE